MLEQDDINLCSAFIVTAWRHKRRVQVLNRPAAVQTFHLLKRSAHHEEKNTIQMNLLL